MIGIRTSARLLNVLMFVKLGMLALLISAVFFIDVPVASQADTTPSLSTTDIFKAFGLCFIPIFFTYGGYQQTINFGKDIGNAHRTMPRAIFFGISIILIVYLAVNYSFYKVLGFSGLASSTTIAADVSGLMFGSVAYKVVAVIMFLSVMAYVNVGLMSNPRVYFAMAEDNILPPIFKRLNSRTQVQEFALTIFCVFILITLFFLSSFQKILEHVMFFDSIGFITAAAAIFILRYRAKKDGVPKDIFRIKGYPVLPAIFILVYVAVNVSVFYTNPTAAVTGFVLFALGLPLYYLIQFLLNRRRKKAIV
jgi:APA family basic amino acid/polyamine antiporter